MTACSCVTFKPSQTADILIKCIATVVYYWISVQCVWSPTLTDTKCYDWHTESHQQTLKLPQIKCIPCIAVRNQLHSGWFCALFTYSLWKGHIRVAELLCKLSHTDCQVLIRFWRRVAMVGAVAGWNTRLVCCTSMHAVFSCPFLEQPSDRWLSATGTSTLRQ